MGFHESKISGVPMITENDALPLEYKLRYGEAMETIDISAVMSNPEYSGIVYIERHDLTKELK